MKVWEHKDQNGRTCAIEVPSLTSRSRTTRIVGQVAGVRVTRRPKLFSWFREDCFCELELNGEPYHILEPFGDNSRYKIGRPQFSWHPDFHRIVTAFEAA